ncbi:MAG: hypothetical protein Q4G70_03115 [Pseudomonadota bacterium]|nr:hypothetical protein [Pseudomonadota bacterium]
MSPNSLQARLAQAHWPVLMLAAIAALAMQYTFIWVVMLVALEQGWRGGWRMALWLSASALLTMLGLWLVDVFNPYLWLLGFNNLLWLSVGLKVLGWLGFLALVVHHLWARPLPDWTPWRAGQRGRWVLLFLAASLSLLDVLGVWKARSQAEGAPWSYDSVIYPYFLIGVLLLNLLAAALGAALRQPVQARPRVKSSLVLGVVLGLVLQVPVSLLGVGFFWLQMLL